MEHYYLDEYRRLQEYAKHKRVELLNRLGWTMDGLVDSTPGSLSSSPPPDPASVERKFGNYRG